MVTGPPSTNIAGSRHSPNGRAPGMAGAALLEMDEITKSFGAGQVLKGVHMSVRSGEIRALVGQNGAGKSTLMKILCGLYPDHGGTVRIAGEPADLGNPRQALDHGVAVIQQEFSLVPQMSVAANIMLGREPGRVGRTFRPSDRQLVELARQEVQAWGLSLALERPVSELSVAGQQMVEIVKALARRARLLVMDEPTARLSAPERERLFGIIRSLADADVGVIYISHYLEEVFRVADTVTVLRDGSVVADTACADLDPGRLSALMLGKELQAEVEARSSAPAERGGQPMLRTAGLTCEPYFRDVSLTIHAREVVAITGLVGSGRTRLVSALIGALKGYTGEVQLVGNPYRPRNPSAAVRRGVVSVPEDRKRQGLVMSRSAGENIIMLALDAALSRFGFVRRRDARRLVRESFERLRITPPRPSALAGSFSGGNQQKIAIAKALIVDPKVLVLDQPTAGVDVGTKADLHRLIRRTAAEGRAVLIVSDDIDEVLAVSDRVLVMERGQIVTMCDTVDVSRDELLALITGAKK